MGIPVLRGSGLEGFYCISSKRLVLNVLFAVYCIKGFYAFEHVIYNIMNLVTLDWNDSAILTSKTL